MFAAVAVGLALLCGCQQEKVDQKQVLSEAGKLLKPLPGLYRSTTSLKSFELPGADPRMADMMHDRFAQVLPQRREFCLTPEAASHGFEDLIRQSQQGDCRIERFVANANRLSARLSCSVGAKLASTVSVEGTGAPDRSHIELEIVQTGPSLPGGSETIVMQVDNVRAGDCPQ